MWFFIKKIFLLVIGIFIFSISFSQSNISLKVSSLTMQASLDKNVDIYKNNLTENGKWLIEPGLVFSTEFFFVQRIATLKLIQGIYLDRADKLSGFTHIGFNRRILKRWKHSFNVGIGTSICYRKDWQIIENYQTEKRYIKAENGWYYTFQWLSFEIEYDYALGKNIDLSVSINTIRPRTVALAIGLRYWINKKRRKRRGGCNCPQF